MNAIQLFYCEKFETSNYWNIENVFWLLLDEYIKKSGFEVLQGVSFMSCFKTMKLQFVKDNYLMLHCTKFVRFQQTRKSTLFLASEVFDPSFLVSLPWQYQSPASEFWGNIAYPSYQIELCFGKKREVSGWERVSRVFLTIFPENTVAFSISLDTVRLKLHEF